MEKRWHQSESIKCRIAKLNLSQVGLNMDRVILKNNNTINQGNLFQTSNTPQPYLLLPRKLIPPLPRPSITTASTFATSSSQPIPTQPKYITSGEYGKNKQPATVTSTVQANDCLICRNFDLVDEHAAKIPRGNVTSIRNLSQHLCSRFVSKTDKARAIFTWLHHNVAYNTAVYFGNRVQHQTPEETLRSGMAVCQGYAELFEVLARHANLDVIVVSGHGKGYSYTAGCVPVSKSNHAWNAVRFDSGKWHLIDPCWGAGHTDENRRYIKMFNPEHFTSQPEIFRLKHFSTNPKYQFCSPEMSWQEYISMKEGPLIYTGFRNKGFSEESVQPNFRVIAPKPTKFVITSKCQHTSIPLCDQYVLLLTVDGVHKPFQVDSVGKTWTCETSSIRQGSSVSANYLDKLGDNNAKGVTVQEYLQLKDRVGMSWCGLCKWEVR